MLGFSLFKVFRVRVRLRVKGFRLSADSMA